MALIGIFLMIHGIDYLFHVLIQPPEHPLERCPWKPTARFTTGLCLATAEFDHCVHSSQKVEATEKAQYVPIRKCDSAKEE